ncbi:ABC transporter permease [Alicyclobacillus fastidiosus]|uniref:ABC transporter permease n=1 Tax=Alicyclobacillus fastidiosus TaxID=392011 RepID=A0ABY6ZMP7_9BACL|nr:ABC transporter permease [Alicyclobacillus fastidiosus]WAH44095.1 ABC transporter permease [Alicyclobacillus fastidiosus]
MAVFMTTANASVQATRRRSQLSLAWRRYRRNWLAVAGLVWVILFIIIGIIGPWIAPQNYAQTNFLYANHPPSAKFPFGTDGLGHDMLSQILWSVQNALEIAFGATLVSFIIGTALGLWAGLQGGVADMIIMRLVDFMFAFPAYFLNLILVVKFGRGMLPILMAIGVTGWAGYARLIRSLVLGMRNGEMVEAARALGATRAHIARRYLLPNVVSSMLVALAFGIPGDLTVMAGLSVVGMGLLPPLPSFGNMIAQAGSNVLGYPWLLYFPAGVFAITLLSFLFVADGLQEALNPKGGY